MTKDRLYVVGLRGEKCEFSWKDFGRKDEEAQNKNQGLEECLSRVQWAAVEQDSGQTSKRELQTDSVLICGAELTYDESWLPGGSQVKNLSPSAGGTRLAGSILGLGRPHGGGNGTPLQYSCWKNPRDTKAWGATVHGVAKIERS